VILSVIVIVTVLIVYCRHYIELYTLLVHDYFICFISYHFITIRGFVAYWHAYFSLTHLLICFLTDLLIFSVS
jgi:hypothetical protein